MINDRMYWKGRAVSFNILADCALGRGDIDQANKDRHQANLCTQTAARCTEGGR